MLAEKARLRIQAERRIVCKYMVDRRVMNSYLEKLEELSRKLGEEELQCDMRFFFTNWILNKLRIDPTSAIASYAVKKFPSDLEIKVDKKPSGKLVIVRKRCKIDQVSFFVNVMLDCRYSCSAGLLAITHPYTSTIQPIVFGRFAYRLTPEKAGETLGIYDFKVPILPTKKSLYEGRLTVKNRDELNFVKKILTATYTERETSILALALLKDGENRLFAFESIEFPGKPMRQRWREKIKDEHGVEYLLVGNIRTVDHLIKLMEVDDAGAFYPSVFEYIEYKGIRMGFPTRIVIEVDPRYASLKRAKKVFIEITKTLHKFRIPYVSLFSGNKSARDQIDVDKEEFIENFEELYDDFSICGMVKEGPIKSPADKWKRLNRALLLSIAIDVFDRCKDFTLDRERWEHIPLMDSPATVSIAKGSLKSLRRLSQTKFKELKREDDRFRNWPRPIIPLFCTLIEPDEVPISQKEIFDICNPFDAAERAERFLIEMGYKRYLTTDILRKVFSWIEDSDRRRQMFEDLCRGELIFRKNWLKNNS